MPSSKGTKLRSSTVDAISLGPVVIYDGTQTTLPEFYRDVVLVSSGRILTAFRDDDMWAIPKITGKTARIRLEQMSMTPIAVNDAWAYIEVAYGHE